MMFWVFLWFSWISYGFSYGFLSPTSGRRVDLRGDRRPPPWGHLPEVSLIWAPWERKKTHPSSARNMLYNYNIPSGYLTVCHGKIHHF